MSESRPKTWPRPAVASDLRGSAEPGAASPSKFARPFVASAAESSLDEPFSTESASGASLISEEDGEGPIIDISDIVDDSVDEEAIHETVDLGGEVYEPSYEEASFLSPAGEGTAAQVPVGNLEDQPLPDWMRWIDEPDEIELEPDAEPSAALPSEQPTEPEPVYEPTPTAEAESVVAPEPEIVAATEPAVQPAPEPAVAVAASLGEVADRLERIASSLRHRSPAELLAGNAAADPLELLITGFVLGYAQRTPPGGDDIGS